MKFSLSKEIFEIAPDAKVGALVLRNIDNTRNPDGSYQNLWSTIESTALEFLDSPLEEFTSVATWQEAFQNAGINPRDYDASHIALLRRVKNRIEIPNINPLVNVLNTVSIGRKVPIGGHDMDMIDGDITVGPNTNKLDFTGKEKTVESKELVYADEKNVLTRKWVWREGKKTMATPDTRTVFIPIDGLSHTSGKELADIAKEIAALAKVFLKNGKIQASFAIVDKDTPEVELDELPALTRIKVLSIKTYPISKDPDVIDRLTRRGVERIYPEEETLRRWLVSGRRLTVYQGFDPTADTLHIGHTVGMRKLRDFQFLGHNVIFMIGDFTARVGDPSDKVTARRKLSKEDVEANMQSFKEQASRILDFENKDNPVTILFNSTWLEKLDFGDILELSAKFSVQQMIKRDMFQRRLALDRPIYIMEFMYPLMQAYDSQHMNVDVEVGGNDQTFNMLAGRTLTAAMRNKEKAVVSCKLLVDPKGKKMGKTEGNMIMLSDTPEDMYGKVMAFSDSLIVPSFEILTDEPMENVKRYQNEIQEGTVNPMELKKKLAFIITAEHKGEKAAKQAEKHFETVFQQRKAEITGSTPEFSTGKTEVPIVELLTSHTGFADSNSRAKRLVEQGAVSIDGEKITDKTATIPIPPGGLTLRAGRHIAHIVK
jgi:tyrosyl-tRNA synthetase